MRQLWLFSKSSLQIILETGKSRLLAKLFASKRQMGRRRPTNKANLQEEEMPLGIEIPVLVGTEIVGRETEDPRMIEGDMIHPLIVMKTPATVLELGDTQETVKVEIAETETTGTTGEAVALGQEIEIAMGMHLKKGIVIAMIPETTGETPIIQGIDTIREIDVTEDRLEIGTMTTKKGGPVEEAALDLIPTRGILQGETVEAGVPHQGGQTMAMRDETELAVQIKTTEIHKIVGRVTKRDQILAKRNQITKTGQHDHLTSKMLPSRRNLNLKTKKATDPIRNHKFQESVLTNAAEVAQSKFLYH